MVQRWDRGRVSRLSCWSLSWTSSTCSATRRKTTLILTHKVELQYMLSSWLKLVWPCLCKNKKKIKKNKAPQKSCFLFYLSGCQSERPEGQMGTLMENVVLFSKMLVQKLHSGTFLGDPENLLNFLSDQIVVVRQMQRYAHTVVYTQLTWMLDMERMFSPLIWHVKFINWKTNLKLHKCDIILTNRSSESRKICL